MAKKKKRRLPFRLELGWWGIIAFISGSFAILLWILVLGVWIGKKISIPKMELLPPPVESPIGLPNEEAKEAAAQNRLFSMSSRENIPQNEIINRQSGEGRSSGIIEEDIRPKKGPSESGKSEKSIARPKKERPIRKEARSGVHKTGRVSGVKTKARTKTAQKTSSKSVKKEQKPRPFFALQVASFRTLDTAKKEVIKWRKRGYPVTLKTVNLGPRKGVWHRVCVGKYPSIEEARKGAQALIAKFKQKSYIIPVR